MSIYTPDNKFNALSLVVTDEFEVTSTHANWRGKVKCDHCNAKGYAGSVETNPLWWGQRHGRNCRYKGLQK